MINARHLGVIALTTLAAAAACMQLAPAQTPQAVPPAMPGGDPHRMPHDPIPRLTVRGEAELDKPADQLNLSLGVVTQATEAAQAIEENSRRMNDVVAALTKVGLTDKEYRTGRFSVQPQYSPHPRNPQPDWRPEIIGYHVTNTLQIKTQKLELAGDLIQAATDAGANSVDSIYFDLADRRKHRAEVIKTATENAISDANALAMASKVRLVRVLSIDLDGAQPIPVHRDGMEMMRGIAMDAAATPPITPGDITLHASVTIVYEIADER